MTLRKKRVLITEREGTRSHYVENSLCKRMWTSPTREYIIMVTQLELSLPFSQAEASGLYPRQDNSKVISHDRDWEDYFFHRF